MIAALLMCLAYGVLVSSPGDLVIPGIGLTLGMAAIPLAVIAAVVLINAAIISERLDGVHALQILLKLAELAALTPASAS